MALLTPLGPFKYHCIVDFPYRDGTMAADHGDLWLLAETHGGEFKLFCYDGSTIVPRPFTVLPCIVIWGGNSAQVDLPIPEDPRLAPGFQLAEAAARALYPECQQVVLVGQQPV